MSVVAIRSTDSLTWQYHGVVANASGPGGYPTSAFGQVATLFDHLDTMVWYGSIVWYGMVW